MKTLKRALGLILCAAMIWSGSGGTPAEQAEKPAPTVRVLLQRLNLTDRIDLELQGDFLAKTENGTRIHLPAGSGITVQTRDGKLILFLGSFALDAGKALTLTRQRSGSGTDGFRVLPYDGVYPADLKLTVSGGQLQPVATVSVEDYLLGVVPYEMSDDFPIEALKAQAICARTYALSRVDAKREWDLVDTTNDQVFRAVMPGHVNSARAVAETAGLVVTSRNVLANCYYGASNGGQTELPEHVWSGRENSTCYAITDDPYDTENPESPVRKARLQRDGSQIPEDFMALVREAAWKMPGMEGFARTEDAFRIDEITEVKLTSPRYKAPSRLMTQLEMTMSVSAREFTLPETPDPLTYEEDGEEAQETEAPADTTPEPTVAPEPVLGEFRAAGILTVKINLFPYAVRALGLSIYGADNEIITVTEEAEAFVLSSGRYGHGVGMSQRGAQWMAAQYGKNFQEILDFYFPGSVIKKAASGAMVLPTADPDLAKTPGPAATPTPRPTLMPVSTAEIPEGAWIASVENIEDDSTLNLRAEPSASAEILMRLYKHQKLMVLEICEDPAWAHVKTDAAEGYVMISFLERAE